MIYDKEIDEKVKAAGARLVYKKDSWFWRALHYVVLVVTFGGNRKFRTSYITTIGPVIAFPDSWPPDGAALSYSQETVILHELVHVAQFKRWGLGSAWVGILPMFCLYVLLPLPLGFAWGRWVLEREAYLQNLQRAEKWGQKSVDYEIERIVDKMTGGHYGYTLAPFEFVKNYIRKWAKNKVNTNFS